LAASPPGVSRLREDPARESEEVLEIGEVASKSRGMIPALGCARGSGFGLMALMAALVGLSGCMSTEQVSVSEDTVYSPPLHWNITKPNTWRFVSQRDVRDAQHASNSTNKLYNYAMYQAGATPFVAIERAYRINSDYGPNFEIHREPLDEDRFASNEKILGQELWSYLYVITGARVVGPSVHVKIGGKDFMNGRVQYPLKTKSGKSFDIWREVWVCRTGLSAVIITASYELHDQLTADKEVRDILGSITEKQGG
jgi:hypothetical protein